ncbi:hypothetical protein MNBD_BACTEROID03-1973 [hydrothermal vent metagenome]|uniref:Uncharacterized protein n=1 Tax=hydrothermal vent metagenome TaxID=652676 RepID=A0A3B0TI62_9ZZZZ
MRHLAFVVKERFYVVKLEVFVCLLHGFYIENQDKALESTPFRVFAGITQKITGR